MDRLSDQRDFVIKVKHGDTLRRIGAYVHGQVMDQNISKLREKIISLFKFNPDADFILTYTDEDGDLVTLDNDDELRDAVIKQQLNPLRINVELKSNTSSSNDARSKASSPTADKSPQSPQSGIRPIKIHFAADEILKSMPEPLESANSYLSGDVNKVVTSAPEFVQVAESFSKLDLSNVTQHFYVTTGQSSERSSGVSAELVDCKMVGKPKDSGVQTQESRGTISVGAAQKQHEYENTVQGTVSDSFDLNQDIPKNSYPVDDLLASLLSDKEGGNATHDGKSDATADPTSNLGESVQWVPIYDRHTGLKIGNRRRGAISSNVPPISPANWSSGTSFCPPGLHLPPLPVPPTMFHTPYPPPPASQFGAGYCSVGPMDALAKNFPPIPFASSGDFASGISHRGTQCDGCFMQPIVGARFKSKVKDNYDLCSLCFSNSWMGSNEADYTRIDLPIPQFKKHPILNSKNHIGSSNVSHSRWESSHKLQSCFIQDVTIVDGTVMAPSTPFIKIWRVRNSGTLAWPFRSRLVYDGGDRFFAGEDYTDLQIPASGFPAGVDLDIAVDFISPSRPGRYCSYWRLQSPLRRKFGPRIWVQIQVEESKPNTPGSSADPIPDLNDTNLNESHVETGKSMDVNAKQKFTYIKLKPLKSEANRSLHSQMNKHYPPHPSSSPADDVNEVEQILLKELEGMGFEQADMNKSVLRMNNYDLKRTLDDLFGFAGWDPLLDELQAMGFSDEELNKKLLIKNRGSIKRAVMDLIAEEDKIADLLAEEQKFA